MPTPMRLLAQVFLVFVSMSTVNIEELKAQEISFWETFALSEDRQKALEQLVPGSEEYYFFHCLHAQNQQKLDEVDSLLKRWAKRSNNTQQYRVIVNRQALLKYGEDPKATLDHLKRQLNLDFNHQRQIPQAQKNLPTSLAADRIDPTKLTAKYLKQDSNSLNNFASAGLRYLVDRPLNTRQRRELLKRIDDPTFPGLVDLIAKDLSGKDAQRFGQLDVHRLLTKAQLEELATKVKALNSQKQFVDEFLRRLQPSEDVNLSADPIAYRTYLEQVWEYVSKLDPTFNSLKANVLFRLLELDQRENRMDRKRFLDYLKLPRREFYVNRRLLDGVRRDQLVLLRDSFSESLRSLPISKDEPLVRDYLHHFLVAASNTKKFAEFFEDDYLKTQFATAKILAGVGDREQLASMLTPAEYQMLLERIDLDFAPTNREQFAVADEVELELFTKNIDKLIVKVFEINTQNYYRKYGKEIDTDIRLDGLVANDEQLYEYDDSPLLRQSRKFKFAKIDKRGVYVVDFIGGGKSSRALIRKGRLQIVGQVTPLGQRFHVVNGNGALVEDASLSIGGQNYSADENGHIDVPFSTQSQPEKAVVTQGDFSSLQSVEPVREQYSLTAAFHVDRESLARNKEATVLVRPSLTISGGHPIPLSRLKSCTLNIVSTTIDGNASTKTVTEFSVDEAVEATATFRVPPRLRTITFQIEATLDTLLNQETTLNASQSFSINQIDTTAEIVDVHLLPTSQGYFLEVLGKSGERRAGQPVRFDFKVAGLKPAIRVDLQSDKNGQIKLGDLGHVESIAATTAGGSSRRWDPNPERMQLEPVYHLLADQELRLPLPQDDLKPDPTWVSLLEVRQGRNVRDCFENLSVSEQRLQIAELSPGDYQLTIRDPLIQGSVQTISVRVTEGSRVGKTLVGQHRILKAHNPSQPFASMASVDKEKLSIAIADVTPTTRVHVFPVRYLNAFDPFDGLNVFRGPRPWTLSPSIENAAYMAGRKIGEEYQYILDRRYAAKFPGNMLSRPSLLMNPWAVQETSNEAQSAMKGERAARSGVNAPTEMRRDASRKQAGVSNADFANLDFLGGGQDAILNLDPDDKGVVELTAEQIGNAQAIRIVVVDVFSVTQTSIVREPRSFEPEDQRLANALDPDKHFRQSRQIEIMDAGDQLVIEDILSAQFQQYGQLSDVFSLYQSIGNDAEKLAKFRFVLEWFEKEPAEKRELYSQHACHELNFWIFKKDTAFFDEVVRQHLLNKRERTFMDRWLLEEDLTEFLEPWRFARLNVVEKILLARRRDDRFDDFVRHVNELYDLNPTPRAVFDELYDASLMSRRLEEESYRMPIIDGDSELPELKEEAESFEMQSDDMSLGLSFGRPQSGGGMGGGGLGGGGLGGGVPVMGGRGAVPMAMPLQRQALSESLSRKKSDAKPATKRRRIETRSRVVDGKVEEYSVEVPETEALEDLWPTMGQRVEALYRRVEPTREWIENNYYQLLPEAQNSDLVSVNQFWKDYANHEGGTFLSPWFAESNGNFTEMMFALAVLDLPLSDVEEKIELGDGRLTVTATGPTIVLHQQSSESEFERKDTTVFVSENFYQSQDRFRYENGVQFDKFVDGKFLANVLYGSEVVITNPTSTPMAIELLIQIPRGAVPVSGSQQTRTIAMQLNAFSTQKFDYAFYFPTAGAFTHYPAHVASDVKVLAVAESRDFEVVDEPATRDESSWAWISQNGSEDDVIEFLERENIQRIDASQIAFRMQEKPFFERAIETLRKRFRYDHTLWSYAVAHNDAEAIGEFLNHADNFTTQLGMAIDSELLTLDPVERDWYQQREFSPLVNSRAHQLGPQRTILNDRFRQQYELLMTVLGHRSALDSDAHLVVTYYMLLQDRVDEALQHFDKIESKEVLQSMAYAYCDAYLDLYREQPDAAKTKASKWLDYPVDRWRTKFESIVAMVDEIQGGASSLVDKKDRTQQQDQLASSAPGFEFEINASAARQGAGKGSIAWRNIEELTLNYYEMDIEFLFSSNPFARDQNGGFSMIRPNLSQQVTLKQGLKKGTHVFDLPDQFDNKNVLVEVVAGDDAQSRTWFANSMEVQVIESYGQVLLTDPNGKEAGSKAPISRAYVKVFAKNAAGKVEFHKDGYTDLRGRFDYVTQSNRSIDGITDYAILIISDEKGAVIREAKPPRE